MRKKRIPGKGKLALVTTDAPMENPKKTKGGPWGKSKIFLCSNCLTANSHTTYPS